MEAPRRVGLDRPLLFITIILVAIGIVMVFSSSGALANESYRHPFHFLINQVIGVAAGFLLVFVILSLKRSFFLNPYFIYGLLVTTAVLLMLCLVMPTIAGVNRWIVLFGFRFQPSELAKISLVFFLASFLESRKHQLDEWKVLAVPLTALAVIVLLVLIEPDFSTGLLLAATSGLILFIGGVKLRKLVLLGALAAVVFGVFLLQTDYQLDRIKSLVGNDPQNISYQARQSTRAVGSGGLLGVSLGRSTQKLYFLPNAHTDFIFAILGEETGLVGTFVTLTLYFLFLWRGLAISRDAPTPAHKMVAAGITFAIAAQALINITIVLGMGPVTGIPLPFISYGRSALITNLAAVGVLLHISRKRNPRGMRIRI